MFCSGSQHYEYVSPPFTKYHTHPDAVRPLTRTFYDFYSLARASPQFTGWTAHSLYPRCRSRRNARRQSSRPSYRPGDSWTRISNANFRERRRRADARGSKGTSRALNFQESSSEQSRTGWLPQFPARSLITVPAANAIATARIPTAERSVHFLFAGKGQRV